MRFPTPWLTTVATAAMMLTTVMSANAFDLTGTWKGSWKCSEFDNGSKDQAGNPESTLLITSLGNNTFAARLDNADIYRGVEIPNTAKPEKGELAIVNCGGSDDLTADKFTELGRFKVATKGPKGTLSGITVWSADPTQVATCKYKYKRVDTLNPNLIYACP